MEAKLTDINHDFQKLISSGVTLNKKTLSALESSLRKELSDLIEYYEHTELAKSTWQSFLVEFDKSNLDSDSSFAKP
ncbi:hypothetical protein [Vibrio metschnikovii]|uniref:hypothetical protein n=1 Tax=Vibrio metschnikovii TaxID=28172 RepID=UPI001C2F6758|nr:hypothetical protein [Vibrio metschnikovii]